MASNARKPSKKSILSSMSTMSIARPGEGDETTSVRNRSSTLGSSFDADDDPPSKSSSSGAAAANRKSSGSLGGRFRSISGGGKKKGEEPVSSSNGTQDVRRTNYSQRASTILQQQRQEDDELVEEEDEEPETANDVKAQALQGRGGGEKEQQEHLPEALSGGGYLDENVASMNLDDPSSKAGKREGAKATSSTNGNGGIIAAATGGVTAALAGAGSLLGRNGADQSQPNASEQDPELPEEEEPDFDNEEPTDRGDAHALIDEEKKQDDQRRAKPAAGAQTRELRQGAKIPSLTPIQRHYLIKALVSIQMQMEWGELEKLGALTQYGFPFSLERPKLKRIKNKNQTSELSGELAKGDFAEAADDPYADVDDDELRRQEGLMEPLILRHMFHAHLHTFPGLDKAPTKYWQRLIQPFFDEMAARNFSSSIERSETSARHFYTLAMTRYLGGFFARGVGVRGQDELRGPGKGEPGTERWGKGKQWGKGTVKRGLDKPARPDDDLMEKIDDLFDGREGEVWRRAGKETKRVKNDWRAFKEFNIEHESGVEETMAYLDIGNLRNLPTNYKNAEEYARHHTAYIFHTLFVNSPNADSFYNILRGIHLLFPYWGAKQLLKVANAQTMIQGILNLLLARPAGAKSLVQRIFVSVIGGQASTFNKEYVQPLKKEINDAELCNKLEDYVKRGNRPEGKAIRHRALRTGQDVLATILLFASGPQLSQSKKNEVLDWHDAFARSPYRGTINAAYPPSTLPGKDANQPRVENWTNDREEQKDALKYAMLKLFLRDLLRRRDRDEACKMASGSLVPTIIKESLDTVFYGPIKSIATHSDLSARLGDLQAFFDDVIKTRKNSKNTLPDWIALTARHENSLYFLFHECATIIQPFTQWLQGGADYMALSTTDPNHPANRKAKNIEVNVEELLQDASLTDDDVHEILAEADRLAEYVKWQKVWYELEMRKNFLLSQDAAIPASGLSEDDVPSTKMRQEIEDVDGLVLELMEREGVQHDDGTIHSDVRGTEVEDFPWAWFDVVDPLHQHLQGTDPTALKYKPRSAAARLPAMKHTRKALEPFQFALLKKMPAWREGDENGVPATPRQLRTTQQQGARRTFSTHGGGGPDDSSSTAAASTKAPSESAKGGKSRFKLPFGRG